VPAQRILNLHGIGSPEHGVAEDERSYWISHQAFISLLQTIVVTREGSDLPVAITFDDGNESDALIALPELAKRSLKAIFFVVAGRIGLPHYLDRVALRNLMSAGMEIGSHGLHHCDWRNLDSMMLHVEVDGARRRIEDLCGRAVTKVGIPFGSYDRHVLKQLRAERLDCVYTSDGGLAQSEAWLRPRQTICSNVSEAAMKSLITGYPSLPERLRRSTATKAFADENAQAVALDVDQCKLRQARELLAPV
jgi:peptidoglycan/xylan/chitin deacetylase (PgdA/CDA1 family)